ncbi:glycosyltransferase [Myroides odoratus]|uniref:Glycosyltransferase n=1 Tax=Myroides odoratus TaxID=256 RepID=A0A9Q7EBA5_MYROD|nr:glycosyltransferase [Myroides odoratus]QQU01084.1 glycosyltransferase [Myroides odoratus]WQD56662.1 glycosyltransferase [Myroides odoratus]
MHQRISYSNQYQLKEDEVCISAKPDVAYLVDKLSELIDNKAVINEIGQRAQAFVQQIHDCKIIANQYINTWESRN